MTKRERLRLKESMQEICRQLDVMRVEAKTTELRFRDLNATVVQLGHKIDDVTSDDDE